jgi:enterochelin esterase-like enzyme
MMKRKERNNVTRIKLKEKNAKAAWKASGNLEKSVLMKKWKQKNNVINSRRLRLMYSKSYRMSETKTTTSPNYPNRLLKKNQRPLCLTTTKACLTGLTIQSSLTHNQSKIRERSTTPITERSTA